MTGQRPASMDEWREWLHDEAFVSERMARLRASKHGNRMAFESLKADFKAWRTVKPKYDAFVWLQDDDSDPRFIVEAVAEALLDHDIDPAEVMAFREECAASDHEDPLAVCMQWAQLAL